MIADKAATQLDRDDSRNNRVEQEKGDGKEPESGTDVPTFPEAAWRGPFADYRAAMDGTSEAPDSVHFSALWANAATWLRRRVYIYYAMKLYPNVFLLNFGPTGESKTSAARQGLGLLPDDERVKVLGGVGSAEALGDWMSQSGDGGSVAHLLFLEELSTLLIRGGWDGSTLLGFLTETFDAPDLYEVLFRKNPVRVIEPTPTMLAGTTPVWFWKSMREIDFHGGFGNRLFFLTGSPKGEIPRPGKPNAAMLECVREALRGLDKVLPCEMDLEAKADELWGEFYSDWKKLNLDPLVTAATKRIPAYAMKLALVYAAFEKTAPLITADQMAAAIQVARFGIACAERLIKAQRPFSVIGRCEEAVCRALMNEALPAWRIHQKIGGRFSADDMARALGGLQRTGIILVVGSTSRHETIYRLREGHG